MSWKAILALGIVATLGATAYLIVHFILANPWILLIPGAIILLIAGWFAWNMHMATSDKRAAIRADRERIEAERDEARMKARAAKYKEYKDGFGMIHVVNLETDIWENLSTYPGTHHNGHWEEPHPAAAAAWHALVSKRGTDSPVAYLPAGAANQPESRLDLLTIFTQPTQSYAIIGGQQTGKTFQARRIAQYWLDSGIVPAVIGPKWDTGEWAGCKLFGGEYDFEAVQAGMAVVESEAMRRHADKDMSHKQQPILPVFFDDWTAIRAKLESTAEAFIVDATTLYASVNIILYFIIHLDTANAWGVGKVGAALHQNFYKLFIEPGHDTNGLIDRRLNKGFLIMPGQSKKDRQEIGLFNGTGRALLPDLVINPNEVVQASGDDARIIEMIRGGRSYKEVSESVWGMGKFGKFYNDKIDRILARYGVRS